jgi:hypothetical protein
MRVSLVAAASVLIAGCAALSVSDTPAQALARER